MKLPRLKEVRELHGWSQTNLAEESGVSRDSISNYETGHREAYPATAKRLADALDVAIADLVEPARELATSGKAEAPATGQSLLEKALDAARQDEEKDTRAIRRAIASEGVPQVTHSYEEDRFRAELRALRFPDEHFESFTWPLVLRALRAEQLEQEHERLAREVEALRRRLEEVGV